jgi:dolichyl-phosphate-mannose-protein mannosyltransferase
MLHSHLVPAPITGHEWEVSGYGNETVGDIHDHWILEIASDTGGRKLKHDGTDVVHSLTTKMRFRHEVLGCYLKANNVILPQWGFKQTEVSCDKDNNPSDPHTMWNVEQHINDRREYFLFAVHCRRYESHHLSMSSDLSTC